MTLSRRIPWLTLDAAREDIEALTEAIPAAGDIRAAMKLARRLSFAATSIAVRREAATDTDLDRAVAALGLAKRAGGATDNLPRALALLVKRRLERSGSGGVTILAEASRTVYVATGCLVAAPSARLPPEWLGWRSEVMAAAADSGAIFPLVTGCDGRYRVTVRLVDASEPVLAPREYGRMEHCTEVGYLRVGEGEVRFGAPEALEEAARIAVPNGLVRVQAYNLATARSNRTVLVACASERVPPPLGRVQEWP